MFLIAVGRYCTGYVQKFLVSGERNQPLKISPEPANKAFVAQGLYALLYALDLNSVTNKLQK